MGGAIDGLDPMKKRDNTQGFLPRGLIGEGLLIGCVLARWSGFAVDLFVFAELLPGVWLFALYPAKKEYNIAVIGWGGAWGSR